MTGLDYVGQGRVKELEGKRIGLLAHPAAVDCRLRHASEVFRERYGSRVRTLFGPQHGWSGHTQDNMIEWQSSRKGNIPLYSLYGKHRAPTARMLEGIDAVVVDLQDIGTRVYTFIQTLFLVMQACRKYRRKVIVLDRPNPIGGKAEGPLLDMRYVSFVGLTPILLRHGLTIGELALYYRKIIPCELSVIRMFGWKRNFYFEETGLSWVMPSPNMPTVETAAVYPGAVLFEGTNVSEGRGTARPFEIIGSPGITKPEVLCRELEAERFGGVKFRPLFFEPVFHKYAGKLCGGVQFHLTDREKFQPVLTGIALLKAFHKLDRFFKWRKPPYEYERKKLPIDILAGTDKLRLMIEAERPMKEFHNWIKSDAEQFARLHKGCLLYD